MTASQDLLLSGKVEDMADGESVGRATEMDEKGPGFLRRHWMLLPVGAIILAALVIGYWWLFLHNRVSTDDAYVHADIAQVSVRVPGTVAAVPVHNDDPVQVGTVLLELDKEDYRIALDRAQAALAQAEADVEASKISVSLTDTETAAQVHAAQAALRAAREKQMEARHRLQELRTSREGVAADLALAQKDYERFDNLYKQGASSERRREEAQTTLTKAKARLDSLDAQIRGVQSALAAVSQEADRAHAQLRGVRGTRENVEVQRRKLAALTAARDKAKADVEAARLKLSYTTVTAPISGYVAQKSVQVGDRVQPGQALMAVVPLEDVYVEANFKETDLKNVRIGQLATVKADMYPGRTYPGKVAGIRAGTGAVFSLLPAENATGNWIKVVRRIPVRIRLDSPPPPDFPLRVGMSLTVSIDTSDRSGPVLLPERPGLRPSAHPPSAPAHG